MEIQLTKGFVALVDEDDFEELSKFKWHAHVAAGGHVYASREARQSGKRKCVFMHRQLCNYPPGKVVDHINGVGLDNRRANLRVCSHAENIANSRTRKDSASGTRCVSIVEQNDGTIRFKAYAYAKGANKTKLFDDIVSAERWADEMRKRTHGEFAYDATRDKRSTHPKT